MVKMLIMLRRKAGLTPRQFREHFEAVHVKMAERHLVPLMLRYERNYISEVTGGGGAQAVAYDCISEWVLADEQALAAIRAILASPDIGRAFRDDEENFLDRDATLVIRCGPGDVVITKTGMTA